MTSVQDLLQQHLAAWEGAEVVYVEGLRISLAVVKAVRVTDNGAEFEISIEGVTDTISGIWDCLEASTQHVACRPGLWFMYFHPNVVSRVRAADATCSFRDGRLVEKFETLHSIIREARLRLPY